MYENYNYLLNIKYKSNIIPLIILIILLITILLVFVISIYDKYNIYGVYNDNNIILKVPINNSDKVKQGLFMVINNTKYKYEIVDISELQQEENINYQIYKIKVPIKFKENEVLNVSIYSNKERIIEKIRKLIF